MAFDIHVEYPPWVSNITKHFNFFRTHLLVFTITPLVFACILYAANGSAPGNANSTNLGIQRVYFIDSLFLCYSAMTVTGLVTVNVSALNPFQQALLFILFIAGDYSVVSLIVVLVRKHFFRQHCFELLRADHFARTKTQLERKSTFFGKVFTISSDRPATTVDKASKKKKKHKVNLGVSKLGLISRPQNARPMEDYVEERQARESTDAGDGYGGGEASRIESDPSHPFIASSSPTSSPHKLLQRGITPNTGDSVPIEKSIDPLSTVPSRSDPSSSTQGSETEIHSGREDPHPHLQPTGILFHENVHHSPPRPTTGRDSPIPHDKILRQERTIRLAEPTIPDSPVAIRQRFRQSRSRAMSELGAQRPNRLELLTAPTLPLDFRRPSSFREESHSPLSATYPIPAPTDNMYLGFGGFPHPIQLISQLIPTKTKEQLQRHLTMDRRLTIVSTRDGLLNDTDRGGDRDRESQGASWFHIKPAKWMPESIGNLVIGRNSRFFTEELDDEQLGKLGGVEYRSLRLLSWLVFGYILAFQLIPFVILAIYFSRVDVWDSVFVATPGVQTATVNKTWYSLVQVVAAYTGSGFSLVDESMLPLVTCYLLVYLLDITLIAGNHALPMTLRLVIWTGTKIWREGEVNETLHFLLDHPRRCFLYLFPSHQTWYLVLALFAFMGVEMFSFLVLNIGLPVLDNLPSAWEKFSGALLQSLSVRAAGFGVVAIANLAPGTLFIYVILMYVAIYPIAMSVRATNVYEERALGVYREEQEGNFVEPEFHGRRREVFGNYLFWHMRRQLAFDIWPLAIAIWIICIAERGNILDPDKSSWFTIFRIIFECVSAYSTIGLSMGTPNNNYSFSGEFSTVSKLVMIFVMLRGRHRGLPVAIDR